MGQEAVKQEVSPQQSQPQPIKKGWVRSWSFEKQLSTSNEPVAVPDVSPADQRKQQAFKNLRNVVKMYTNKNNNSGQKEQAPPNSTFKKPEEVGKRVSDQRAVQAEKVVAQQEEQRKEQEKVKNRLSDFRRRHNIPPLQKTFDSQSQMNHPSEPMIADETKQRPLMRVPENNYDIYSQSGASEKKVSSRSSLSCPQPSHESKYINSEDQHSFSPALSDMSDSSSSFKRPDYSRNSSNTLENSFSSRKLTERSFFTPSSVQQQHIDRGEISLPISKTSLRQ